MSSYEDMFYKDVQVNVKVLKAEMITGEAVVAHWHEAIELILVVDGHMEVTNDGRRFSLYPGEITCSHSKHLHYYLSGREGCQYYALIFDMDMLPDRGFAEQKLPLCVLAPGGGEGIIQIHRLLEERPAFYAQEIQGILCQLYAQLVRIGGGEAIGQDRKMNIYIKSAIQYIENNLMSELSLEKIAGAIGISPYYLSHIFKQGTGNTLAEYWQRLRCERARKLLHEGVGVAAAAEQSGFPSVSHFRKTYLAQFGILPSRDRK